MIDIELCGVRGQTLPVPGPQKWICVVDCERSEDAAAVEHGGRYGRDPCFGRFHHGFVEIDYGVHI